MKNILLLNPPGDKLYARDKYCTSISKGNYYWPQIDLLCLSGILDGKYNITVIDAIVQNIGFEKCHRQIIEGNFDSIIFLTSSASWDKDFEFIEKLKKEKRMTILANGGFLLYKGVAVMERFTFLDAIILDFTTVDILDYLEQKKAKNMIYRDNGRIIVGERTSQKQFSYPIPRHDLFPLKKYSFPWGKEKIYTCIITSLGCPFRCSFCIPGTINFKLRNINNSIDELKYIYSLGIKKVIFMDSTFTANRKHVMTLCQRIIEEGLKFEWLCLSRVDTIDKELLGIMKKAGCHTVHFGIESGDEDILKDINKGISKEQARKAFRWCREVKIRTNAFFIVGLPGETAKTIRKTIDFAKELECDLASFSLPMPHPGTKLGETLGNDVALLTKNDIYDDISVSDGVNNLSKESILEFQKQAYREFYFRPRYIFKKVTHISSFHELIMYVKGFGAVFKRIFEKSD